MSHYRNRGTWSAGAPRPAGLWTRTGLIMGAAGIGLMIAGIAWLFAQFFPS